MTQLPRPDLGPGYWLDPGGQQVHLMESDTQPLAANHFAIRVDDIDAAVTDLQEQGALLKAEASQPPLDPKRRGLACLGKGLMPAVGWAFMPDGFSRAAPERPAFWVVSASCLT